MFISRVWNVADSITVAAMQGVRDAARSKLLHRRWTGAMAEMASSRVESRVRVICYLSPYDGLQSLSRGETELSRCPDDRSERMTSTVANHRLYAKHSRTEAR